MLIAGGIDLSVGAIYGLAGCDRRATGDHGRGAARGIAAGIAVGLLVGIANGILVTRFRINALIATLAMSYVVSGVGALLTRGNLVVAFDHPDFQQFAATASRADHRPPG